MKELPGIIYLHGLGSSPDSPKARLIAEALSAQGHTVRAPNLSLPSLPELSVDRAIERVVQEIESGSNSSRIALIGSSFGGFLALHALSRVATEHAQKVCGLILLAPLLYPWHPKCGVIVPSIEKQWRRDGFFPIEQGTTGAFVGVHVGFLDEVAKYRTEVLKLSVPTLIIHGEQDESVPIEQSTEFSRQNTGVTRVTVADSHQLLADPAALLAHISAFLGVLTEKVSTQRA